MDEDQEMGFAFCKKWPHDARKKDYRPAGIYDRTPLPERTVCIQGPTPTTT